MHSDHICYFVGKPCILQYYIQWCLFSFCSKRAVHPLNLRYFVPYILTFCPSVGISHLSLRQIHSLCSQHFCLRRAVKTCKTKMWNCFQPVKHCHEEALQETLLNILLYLLNQVSGKIICQDKCIISFDISFEKGHSFTTISK